ncbi:MAG: zinc metallopeptidase [Firmicutes bacterium]|nr:zinc metallopeptidase [Bacillota bacterium]
MWGNYYVGEGYMYFAFIIIAIITLFAQFNVKGTFEKYSEMLNSRGYTGADVARMLLEQSGVTDVSVEPINGSLTDHYDPSKKVIRLSESVYSSSSVAALGVAAHETGHAIQHNEGYIPLKIRSSIFPAVNIGSKLAIPMVFLGMLIGYIADAYFLAYAGVILFTFVVAFQLITLPVEFDASYRAMNMLIQYNFVEDNEAKAARKVLTAAALTYVAAAAASIINLIRLLAMLNGGRRRR